MNSYINKRNKENGFSIMEVTISVAIVAFTFVGMMSLFTYNIKLEIQDRNRIIAAYLAQEAIEVVRQQRDNNWFNSRSAWDGIDRGNGNVIVYLPNPDNIQFNPDTTKSGWDIAVSNSEIKKKIYLYNGNYVQENNAADGGDGWITTPFTRSLSITTENDGAVTDARMKIVVTVGYGAAQPLVVTSYLYDKWY